jgi:hypothetical protein
LDSLIGRVQSLRASPPFGPDVYAELERAIRRPRQAWEDAMTPPDDARAPSKTPYSLLFVGHAIDRPEAPPRFPSQFEDVARGAIRGFLRKALETGRDLHGIAGGSDGGDILFHEVCLELGIRSTMNLPFPPHDFVRSIEGAGDRWVKGFERLINAVEVQVAPEPGMDEVGPNAPEPDSLSDPWYTNARAMFSAALEAGPERAEVLALWNGEWSGPGGPSDVVALATDRGVQVTILNTRELFGPGDEPPPNAKAR